MHRSCVLPHQHCCCRCGLLSGMVPLHDSAAVAQCLTLTIAMLHDFSPTHPAFPFSHYLPVSYCCCRCGVLSGMVPLHDSAAVAQLRRKAMTSLLAPAHDFRQVQPLSFCV